MRVEADAGQVGHGDVAVFHLHAIGVQNPGEASIILVLAAEYLDPLSFQPGDHAIDVIDPEIDHEIGCARTEIIAILLERREQGIALRGVTAERQDRTPFSADAKHLLVPVAGLLGVGNLVEQAAKAGNSCH